MERQKFDGQILRLREEFGDKRFSEEKANLFWNVLQDLDGDDFTESVDFFISSQSKPPLLTDFTAKFRSQLQDIAKRKEAELPPCSECNSTGFVKTVIATRDDDKTLYRKAELRCFCIRGSAQSKTIPQVADPTTYAYDFNFYKCLAKGEVCGQEVSSKSRNRLFKEYKAQGEAAFETSVDLMVKKIIAPEADTDAHKIDGYQMQTEAVVYNAFPPQFEEFKKYGNTVQVRVPNSFVAALIETIEGPKLLRSVLNEAVIAGEGDQLIFPLFTKKSVDMFGPGQIVDIKVKIGISPNDLGTYPFEVKSIKIIKDAGKTVVPKTHNGVTPETNPFTLM